MLQRGLRRGWAGFIGGVFVGFGFLVYVPHMGSRVSDTIAVWAAVAIGAVVGVLVESKISRGFALIRKAVARERSSAGVEAVAR